MSRHNKNKHNTEKHEQKRDLSLRFETITAAHLYFDKQLKYGAINDEKYTEWKAVLAMDDNYVNNQENLISVNSQVLLEETKRQKMKKDKKNRVKECQICCVSADLETDLVHSFANLDEVVTLGRPIMVKSISYTQYKGKDCCILGTVVPEKSEMEEGEILLPIETNERLDKIFPSIQELFHGECLVLSKKIIKEPTVKKQKQKGKSELKDPKEKKRKRSSSSTTGVSKRIRKAFTKHLNSTNDNAGSGKKRKRK